MIHPQTVKELSDILHQENHWVFTVGHWRDFFVNLICYYDIGADINNILFIYDDEIGTNLEDFFVFVNTQSFIKNAVCFSVSLVKEELQKNNIAPFVISILNKKWEFFFNLIDCEHLITPRTFLPKKNKEYIKFKLPYYINHFAYNIQNVLEQYIVIHPYSLCSTEHINGILSWNSWRHLIYLLAIKYPNIKILLTGMWDIKTLKNINNIIDLTIRPQVLCMFMH